MVLVKKTNKDYNGNPICTYSFSFFISFNMAFIRIVSLDVIKKIVGAGTEKDQLVLFDFLCQEW
ncbi:hypothetical protein [Halalkalibacter akibai]|uniref:Uncharacterized protein n=1 Tax=Halalkalibacter akibai (strain ATCC 43226 / DSM 21942 / CIP 109018 / JCM 9157 / 1139) TaxID=1236973 RepID=W4QVN8_HALA3|nr:hypothetical protein [Halalkalibacter akibai]GAE35698.1 hypothetical protein JCM9157_2816 [Halalkalibacter akibai JCM 9157]